MGVPRDKEYGLAFYRNMPISRYERGEIPSQEHLLVAPENSQADMVSLHWRPFGQLSR